MRRILAAPFACMLAVALVGCGPVAAVGSPAGSAAAATVAADNVVVPAGTLASAQPAAGTLPGIFAETTPAAEEPTPATDIAPGAAAAVLMDASSGQVLWAKNANVRRPVASVTKLMTIAFV